MRIDVITIFPQMIHDLADYGVTGRAVERGLMDIFTWNPRDFADNRHRTVDDRPYGGGPGMVMMVKPLSEAIHAARTAGAEHSLCVSLSPQGKTLNQKAVRQYASGRDLILIAGRYEGMDERLIELEVDEECSIGDYVLSGGELAAMVLIDAIARLQPGALGDEDSAKHDSFTDELLDCPHFTRPEQYADLQVPKVLLQGNHAEIERWRRKQALGRTSVRRPDLLNEHRLSEQDRMLLEEFRREQTYGNR